MAYPPEVPPDDRLNTTPMVDNHPSDHTVISQAFTDIINEMGADPSGIFATIQARFEALEAEVPSLGMVMWNANDTQPSGSWLRCGQAVSRAAYPDLFAYLDNGAIWGTGDGTTTFDLPPEGVMHVGQDASPFAAVGNTGGAKNAVVVTHTHIQNAHNHTGPNHSHPPGSHIHNINNTASFYFEPTSGNTWIATQPTSSGFRLSKSALNLLFTTTPTNVNTGNGGTGNTGNKTPTNQNAGVSGTNLNLPPYAVGTYWIRFA